MQIHGPHGPHGLSPVFPSRAAGTADPVRPTELEMPHDEIQISAEARLLEEIARTGALEGNRIDEIRQMIARGVYDSPERIAVALDKLLDQLRAGTGSVETPQP